MKFIELEQTKGVLETLMILYREGNKRPTYLIESVSASRETFYKIIKILAKHELIKKHFDEERDAVVWTLTEKGRKIAKHLNEIEKIL